MAKTKYSHAFLVSSFNGNVTQEQLEKDSLWRNDKLLLSPEENQKRYKDDGGYNGLCGLFYKVHLDAMVEAENTPRPEQLKDVRHYVSDIAKFDKISLKLKKNGGRTEYVYSFYLERLHLWFFPFGIVFFAIEVDDGNNDLDDLTGAHFTLASKLEMLLNDEDCIDLKLRLQPLLKYLPEKDSCNIIKDGNKLKLFQVIELEEKDIPASDEAYDAMLYELGTSSPIGCVLGSDKLFLKPSSSYFHNIMKENSLSTFYGWKGLGLMDSFTVLGHDRFLREDDWSYLYFPLIYLRCLFEKTFCFTRNNAYRQSDKPVDVELSNELSVMERYYFYDNISYNFQPNLLYKAMAKGLEIEKERQQLAQQIKEGAKKKEEEEKKVEERKKELHGKRINLIAMIVSVFAVFSAAWDFSSIVQDTTSHPISTVCLIVAIVVLAVIVFSIYYFNRNGNGKQ